MLFAFAVLSSIRLDATNEGLPPATGDCPPARPLSVAKPAGVRAATAPASLVKNLRAPQHNLGVVVARCEPSRTELCHFAVSVNRSTGKTEYDLQEVTTDDGGRISASAWKGAGHAATFADGGGGSSPALAEDFRQHFFRLRPQPHTVMADVPH
jgi:hypothetical protein